LRGKRREGKEKKIMAKKKAVIKKDVIAVEPGKEPAIEPVKKAAGTKEVVSKVKIYKSLFGNSKLKIEPGKYINVKEYTISSSDKEEIAFLEQRRQYEKDLPVRQKTVLTEDEYYSIKSPEKLFINYKGKQMHIAEVRDGLNYAEENGWEAEYRDIETISETKSRVKKSDMGITAGSVSA
jgi:hypothetical protein